MQQDPYPYVAALVAAACLAAPNHTEGAFRTVIDATDDQKIWVMGAAAVAVMGAFNRWYAMHKGTPVKQSPVYKVAGLTFSAVCLLSTVQMYRLPFTWGWSGVAFGELKIVALLALDYLISDHTHLNLITVAENGFSKGQLLRYWLFEQGLVWSWPIVFWLGFPGLSADSLPTSVSAPELILGLLVNLAVQEFFFTYTHRALHTVMAERHHLHHCCTQSSYSTGHIFDPVDLCMEFMYFGLVPTLTWLLFPASFLGGNTWIFVISVIVGNVWLAMDHDEALWPAHCAHHATINAFYGGFIPLKMEITDEACRQLVTRNSSGHTAAKERIARGQLPFDMSTAHQTETKTA